MAKKKSTTAATAATTNARGQFLDQIEEIHSSEIGQGIDALDSLVTVVANDDTLTLPRLWPMLACVRDQLQVSRDKITDLIQRAKDTDAPAVRS